MKGSSTQTLWDDIVIKEEQVGVFKVLISCRKSFGLAKPFNDAVQAAPAFRRLIEDIYCAAPTLFFWYIAGNIFQGLESAFMMQLSSNLLKTIETSLVSKTDLSHELVKALIGRIAWNLLSSFLQRWQEEVDTRMQRVVKDYFGFHLMHAKMRLDIPTSLDPASALDVNPGSAWRAFSDIVSYLTSLLTVASQLLVLFNVATSMNFTFVCMCLAQPLFSYMTSGTLWSKVCYAYVNNKDYIRMKALGSLSKPEYRSDVISVNLVSWILKEWKSSSERRGDLSDDYPFSAYSKNRSSAQFMIAALMQDLPMAFCGLAAILQPSKLSITSIAIFQTSASTLRYTIYDILHSSQRFRRAITSVVDIYKADEIENQVIDGHLSYPLEGSEKELDVGMGFELCDVTFSYPGSKKETPSLDKISVKIPAGSIIVVVGGNGSGKSTLVKLLTRLYDPTHGTILIDSNTASSYTISSLRQSTALLSQDNTLFPLSLFENIGLGYPECVHNEEMVREAARKGGADGFIAKLSEGYETVLDPMVDSQQLNTWGIGAEHPMKVKIKDLKKKIEISGGEKQRVVASRTFMRLQSGNVKFIAVDEPSSAMDAEAELHLFNGILDARQGKTVLFVTHRFGHLTKHADLILCMKDGALVEKGTHEELMEVKGEYCKLYKIQADAFTNNDVKATST